MLSLLLLLILGLLGLGSGAAGAPAPAATTTTGPGMATITRTIFTVDGKALDRRKPLLLRQGQVLRFPRGTENVRLDRLECARDTHRIDLHGTTWRVPDLPTGEYLLSAVVLRHDFDYLVRVRSHAAPCPGA